MALEVTGTMSVSIKVEPYQVGDLLLDHVSRKLNLVLRGEKFLTLDTRTYLDDRGRVVLVSEDPKIAVFVDAANLLHYGCLLKHKGVA